MKLITGLGASAFASGYPGSSAINGMPQGSQTPQGPQNLGQKAFGVSSDTGGGSNLAGFGSMTAGTVALGLLIFIWWTLPK